MNLLHYIKGNRLGKDANRLERESLEDAFLQEAIDGFDVVEGKHHEAISRLEQRIAVQPKRKKRKFILTLSMAASLLILITVGSYFLSHADKDTNPHIAKTIQQRNAIHIQNSIQQLADNTVKPIDTEKKLVEAHKHKKVPVLKNIQGKVLDENGEAVAGAIVKVKDRDITVVTDINGNFTVPMSKIDSTVALLISSLGLEEKTIIANNKGKELQIAMKEEDQRLDELVVTGYAPVQKRDLVTSVSAMSAKSLKDIPIKGSYAFKKSEFKKFFNKKGQKGICGEEKAIVHVEFVIDKSGRPSEINVIDYTCEEAKDEVLHLLGTSPIWTNIGKKVKVKLKW